MRTRCLPKKPEKLEKQVSRAEKAKETGVVMTMEKWLEIVSVTG